MGRFLNVYEPIISAELFRSVEFEYKKRVITEELIEIQSEYGFGNHKDKIEERRKAGV